MGAEVLAYVEEHGKWPTQKEGRLGEWVNRQRCEFVKNDEHYMKYRAPKLDAVGFEWTPRGHTRIKWEDGWELLVEFGRSNGHFNVPNPKTTAIQASKEEVDLPLAKSKAQRLYSWVKSIQRMYRQYKLGRKAGSLTDERVLSLVKIGFVFQNDRISRQPDDAGKMFS